MRDRDDRVAEAEREERLRGRGDEAGDPHANEDKVPAWRTCSSDEEIETRLAQLDGWARDGDAITKKFDRGDFVGSVEFVRRITEPAEEMGHHPDLCISWSEVRISITNHAAGGLTANDFELAGRIDAIA